MPRRGRGWRSPGRCCQPEQAERHGGVTGDAGLPARSLPPNAGVTPSAEGPASCLSRLVLVFCPPWMHGAVQPPALGSPWKDASRSPG